MDPQRKARAGPMALSSIKTARKSFAVCNTYVKNLNSPKEIVTVHTSTPHIEHRPFHSEQNQIYQGEVNVLSIMYCIMLQILYNCLIIISLLQIVIMILVTLTRILCVVSILKT